MMTSSIVPGSIPWRATSAFSKPASNSTGWIAERLPPCRPRPIGVLTASTITGTFDTFGLLHDPGKRRGSADLPLLVAPILCPQRLLVRLAEARRRNHVGEFNDL